MYIKKVFVPKNWAKKAGFLYYWSLNKYYFDQNYNRFLYQPTLRLARKVAWVDWDLYDKYFINSFGHLTNIASKITGKLDYHGIDQVFVDGNGKIVNLFGKIIKTIQTGRLQNYILYVTAGVIILMILQSF